MSNRNKKRKKPTVDPKAAHRNFVGNAILGCYSKNFNDPKMCGAVCPWYKQCVNLQTFYKELE